MRRRKPLRLDRAAEAEINRAIDRYERERAGLGEVFQDALLATLDRIRDFPASFSILMKLKDGRAVRGAIARPFSYRVVYVELPRSLRVLAVAHLARHPDYWKGRVEPNDR